MIDKTLNVVNSEDLKNKVSDVEVVGNPDAWQLLCKASSKKEGWMKSTKIMDLGGWGSVLQVSTQQGDNVAEALVYLPSVPSWRIKDSAVEKGKSEA
jgi:Tfp pilus assembly PilM family ATPase